MSGYRCPFLPKIKYQASRVYFLKKKLKGEEERVLSASSFTKRLHQTTERKGKRAGIKQARAKIK